MSTARTPAAPVWLVERFPGADVLVELEDEGIEPGTVLEYSAGRRVWFPWDGHGEAARGVLLRYVDGRFGRVIVKDATLIGRHLRSGALGRRGCQKEARDDLWQVGIMVRPS